MANPSSRAELKNYCLRRLGEPVVDVNVDDDQLEDRIDDALKFYQDYHYDGTERIFLNFTSTTYVPYVTAMRHVEQLEEIFVGKKPIRFNRHQNRLHIDMDWDSDVLVDEYIIVEAYRILDPNTFTDVYGDRWLREYTTQLFKRQWGENIKKFEGMQLPGGLTFNGQQIYNEALEEIQRLESEVTVNYGGILMDMQA
jgi:hypothetical protein